MINEQDIRFLKESKEKYSQLSHASNILKKIVEQLLVLKNKL